MKDILKLLCKQDLKNQKHNCNWRLHEQFYSQMETVLELLPFPLRSLCMDHLSSNLLKSLPATIVPLVAPMCSLLCQVLSLQHKPLKKSQLLAKVVSEFGEADVLKNKLVFVVFC